MTKNKKLAIIISAGVLLVLACIASVLGIMLFMQRTATPTTDVTPTVTTTSNVTVTTTAATTTVAATSAVSATPSAPSGWDPIVDTKYSYTTYRPHAWYYRIFDGGNMIGIAPSAIPEASDYGGEIIVLRLDNPSSMISDMKASLAPGYTDTTREINGVSWEMVTGLQSGGGVFDDKYVKYGIFTHGSNTFWVELANTAADYGGHADEFETVITSIWFN